MQQKGISESADSAVESLGNIPLIKEFYLAGGTSLAIQLQHRLSFDLDFFTISNFNQDNLNKSLYSFKNYRLDRFEADTLLGMIGDTKISFFRYDNPLIEKTIKYKNIKLAQVPDIAAMKLHAIGDRGLIRDFIDLYFINKKYSLDECIDFYLKKYPMLKDNLFHVIKSLTYFDDADEMEMPKMLERVSWQEVKMFFNNEAKRLTNKYLT